MKRALTGLLLIASFSLVADTAPTGTIQCTAKGLISGKWNVVFNADTRDLRIDTSNGSIYHGTAGYLYSTTLKYHTYFLPLNYQSAVSLQIDTREGREIAMCLKENECYLCKE